MENLITAIKAGQPTLIFEDPFPVRENFPQIAGTFFPRQFARGGPETADIDELFNLLDLDIDRQLQRNGEQSLEIPFLVWQPESANPYGKRDTTLSRNLEMFALRQPNTAPGANYHEDHPAMQGIEEIFFQYAGNIKQNPISQLKYTDLVKINAAGRIQLGQWLQFTRMQPSNRSLINARGAANENMTMAAHIEGSNSGTMEAGATGKENINVIYVADVDPLADYFVNLRNNPIRNGIEYVSQNMSFVQNLIDFLAEEEGYLGIRNRRERHVTLETIDKEYDESLEKKKDRRQRYDATKLERKKALLDTEMREQQARLQTKTQELTLQLNEKKRGANLTAEQTIQKIQQFFKLCAVVIPPIPPLILGIIVFFRRRLREREGISKARRLK